LSLPGVLNHPVAGRDMPETKSALGRSHVADMSEVSDEELMGRFVDGDEACFDQLFERHAAAVQSFLGRIVRDPELAKDLLQQTFLSLVRSRFRYQRGTSVRPWLFTIAGNAARDLLRHDKQVKDHARAVAAEDEKSTSVLPDPALRKRMLEALEALPKDQREAVVLHKVEGWSFGEIAAAFGITETAARIRAHRGYEKLRSLLGQGLET
jgi:RNA polymerase sigma factor (sigma-70 family)